MDFLILFIDVEMPKFRSIVIGIHGGLDYDTGAVHIPVGVPGAPGTIFSHGYNHRFIIK